MFKSKLQEFCQSKGWTLPEYSTTKEGYDHCPGFKASVLVNGFTYITPDFSKSSKDAQNFVAKLALDYLIGSSSVTPASHVSDTSVSNEAVRGSPPSIANPANRDAMKLSVSSSASPATCSSPQPSHLNEAVRATPSSIPNPTIWDDKKPKDMARLYKNQLQVYAQKRNLSLPVYVSEREGPPHAPRFKCKVTVDGKTYECQEYFCTVKDAENAAARIALMSVSSVGTEEEDPGFFKNLLQELAQKEFSCLPEYTSNSSGPSHAPVFISTVEIKDQSFTGQEAKTKKLAEMYAAKVAYLALKERANQKASEYKHVVVQPEASPNIHENTYIPKVEELPFRRDPSHSPASSPAPAGPSSKSFLVGSNEPRAHPHFLSSQKVIVFPRSLNMTLPPGATIKHEDEKYVCVTMDSVHGNA